MPWTQRLPSGTWRALWRDSHGKAHSHADKRWRTEGEAKRYAGEQEAKARRGDIGAPGGRAPLWADWCARWLELRVVEPSTVHADRGRIDRYLLPAWGDRRITQIRRVDVQRWVNDLARRPAGFHPDDARAGRTLSPATVTRVYALFSASMKAAVHADLIPGTPCTGIKIAAEPPGRERYLTRAEFDLIHHHIIGGPERFAALLLVETGLRFGEMAGLHWNRVDLAAGLIHVVETWDAPDRRIKAYPKGKKPRAVPISAAVRRALAEQHDITGRAGPCAVPHADGRPCRHPMVVVGDHGAPLDAARMGQRQWAAAVEHAGVEPVRLHDLRHTYASWLVQGGVPLQEVQRLLGHASITTTERYAHLGATQHARVLGVLDGLVPSGE